MKLVIDRKIWLRGEGSFMSFLLRRADQKQCCVGILCEALGVPKKDLEGVKGCQRLVADLPAWLTLPGADPGTFAPPQKIDLFTAYEINDEPAPSFSEVAAHEALREAKITELFAKHDIQVEFVN